MRKGTTALVAFPLSHTSNVRYIAFSMSFNENKLRTFTLPEMVTTQVKVMRSCYKNSVATDKTKT